MLRRLAGVAALIFAVACAPTVPEPSNGPPGWALGTPWPGGPCDPVSRVAATSQGCPAGLWPIWEDRQCIYVSESSPEPVWFDQKGYVWRVDPSNGFPATWDGGFASWAEYIFPIYTSRDDCENGNLANAIVVDNQLVRGRVYAIFGQPANEALKLDAERVEPADRSRYVWKWVDSGCATFDLAPSAPVYPGSAFEVTDISKVPVFSPPLAIVCRKT
jgi:hypothetical protein